MIVLLAALLAAAPESPRDEGLQQRVAAIVRESKGIVGVAALQVDRGRRMALNADTPFPMASVYKLPIGMAVLRRVDEGALSLDQQVPFTAADLRIQHSPLAQQHPKGGSLPLHDLLARMVSESDNSASDILLRLVGGAAFVTRNLLDLGVEGVRVDRSEAEMAFDYAGTPAPPQPWTRELLQSTFEKASPEQRRQAAARFASDRRDTATPAAMVDLLVRVDKRDALKQHTAALLVDLLTRTTTGPARLKGLLPAEVVVAHKTGTCGSTDGINACTNDVGLISLRGRAGRIAIAVFIVGSPDALEAREKTIARIAQTVYDTWNDRP